MKPVLFAGLYDLPVATGDPFALFQRLHDNGADGFRFFADFAWNRVGPRPFKYAVYNEAVAATLRHTPEGDRRIEEDENGNMVYIRDSGRSFPIFDLDIPREEYDVRLGELISGMADNDLISWISVFDYCTLKVTGDAKYYSPWICSVQSLGPFTPGGVWGDAQWPWMAKFIDRVIRIALVSSPSFRIEIMNEADIVGGTESQVVSWMNRAVKVALDYGIPLPKVYGSSAYESIAEIVGVFSPHGCGNPYAIKLHADAFCRILSSDGYVTGTGEPDIKGRRGVGIGEAILCAKKVVEYGYAGFEFMARAPYRFDNDRGNCDLFEIPPLRAFADEWGFEPPIIDPFVDTEVCTESLLTPNPWCPQKKIVQMRQSQLPLPVCGLHKEPEEPPTPPEPPSPPPPPLTCYEKFIKGRPIGKWDIRRFLGCLFG